MNLCINYISIQYVIKFMHTCTYTHHLLFEVQARSYTQANFENVHELIDCIRTHWNQSSRKKNNYSPCKICSLFCILRADSSDVITSFFDFPHYKIIRCENHENGDDKSSDCENNPVNFFGPELLFLYKVKKYLYCFAFSKVQNK